MSRHEFKLPDIGEGIAEAEIARWRVAVGEVVAEDQPLVDMLTDKAAVELPAPVAGKVLSLHGAEGDKVAVGAVLVILDSSGGATVAETPKQSAVPVAPVTKHAATTRTDAPATGLKPMASPAVRRRARERGVDLASLTGRGPGGRITQDDLATLTAGPGVPETGAVGVGLQRRDGVEQIKIIGMRRKIAEAMQRSMQRIPHFTYVEELDVSELEALRAHLNQVRRPDQPKLTLLPFLMRGLVRALRDFPQFNSRFDDEAGVVHQHQAVNIGIATQTPQGLLVPVVHHAEARDLWDAAAEIKRLAEATRVGKASREDLAGGTITISSLGPLGGVASTPIINAPEVAVVGVNKIVERPVVWNGHIAVRKCMNLSSSFDHRIVDGWDAANFIQRVKQLLEHPTTLFMA